MCLIKNQRSLIIALLTLVVGILPEIGYTLGFGQIKLFSYLNEPLEAEIELLGEDAIDSQQLMASLASAQDFKRAELTRPYFLTKLRFKVVKENAHTFIRVSSQEAVKQPYLEFLVVLTWPSGRLVRGYTLLLDPTPLDGAPKNNEMTKRDEEKLARLVKSNSFVVESLEPLFETDKENPPVAIAKSYPVTIETSQSSIAKKKSKEVKNKETKTNNLKLETETTTSNLSENISKKGRSFVHVLQKNLLLLGSGLALLLCVGLTGWILKRAAFQGPTDVLSAKGGLQEEDEISEEEVEMRLSLARQYLEIQDNKSARELLETVIIQAKKKGRDAARELLKDFAS